MTLYSKCVALLFEFDVELALQFWSISSPNVGPCLWAPVECRTGSDAVGTECGQCEQVTAAGSGATHGDVL